MSKRLICLFLSICLLFIYIGTPVYAVDEQPKEKEITLSLFSNKAPKKTQISGFYKDNEFYISLVDLQEISGATIIEEKDNSVIISTNSHAREYEIFFDKQVLVEVGCEAQHITMPSIEIKDKHYVSALRFLRYIGADVQFSESDIRLNVFVRYNIFDAFSDCINSDLGNFFWWDEVDYGDKNIEDKIVNAGVVALINRDSNIFRMMFDAKGIARESIEDSLISIIQNEGQNSIENNDLDKLSTLNDLYNVEADVAEFIIEVCKSDATKELAKSINNFASLTTLASSSVVNILKSVESLKQYDNISNTQIGLLKNTILQHSKDSPLLCGDWDIVLEASKNINLRVEKAYANTLAESIKLIEESGMDVVGLVTEAPSNPVSVAWKAVVTTMKMVPYTSNIIEQKTQFYNAYNCSMIQCIANELLYNAYADLYYHDFLYSNAASQLNRLEQMKYSLILQYKSTLTTRESLIASKYLTPDYEESMKAMNLETAVLLNKLENCKIVCIGLEPSIEEDLSWLADVQNTKTSNSSNSGNFKNDDYLIEINNTIYYADQNGLWMNSGTGDSKLLHNCKAKNIASNGKVIYYSVYNKDSTAYCKELDMNLTWYQYDLYCYDIKSASNQKVMSFIECGKPVCVYNNKLYYTDRPDDFTGYRVGIAPYLYSFDLDTKKKEFISTDAKQIESYGNRIFYQGLDAANGDSVIYCYNMDNNEVTPISDENAQTFSMRNDKLFYSSYVTKNDTDTTSTLYEYNIADNSVKTIFSDSADEPITFSYVDDKYIYYYYYGDSYSYRINRTNNKTSKLDKVYVVVKTADSAICRIDSEGLYTNITLGEIKDTEDKVKVYDKVYKNVASLLTISNNSVYILNYDDGNFYSYNITKDDFVRKTKTATNPTEEKDTKVSLDDMPIVAHDSYKDNEGDSTIFNLNGKGLSECDDGKTFNYNGNIGIDGTAYSDGFEAWVARWNYEKEISWASATFDLDGKYKSLTGKTNLINSYNTSDFDTTVYFYNGEKLLASYRLTDSDYIKDISVNVSGVKHLKLYIKDNIAVEGGTSFALYNMFLGNTALPTPKNNIPTDALEYEGHHYKIYSNVCDTWEEAKAYCENLGGHLAVISSQKENDALFAYLNTSGFDTAYFGFSDVQNEGEWVWVTDETNSYTNWNVLEPNDDIDEDYAELYWKYTDGTWNDGNFGNGTENDSKNFICEWD